MSPVPSVPGIAPGFDPTSATIVDVNHATVAQLERRTSYSGVDLLATDFPEPRYAVPGILPEGLTTLAGAPKLGKSWLALNIATAVASGGYALGKIAVARGPVHYLALEDPPRTLKERLSALLRGDQPPSALDFDTEWPRVDEGGVDVLRERYRNSNPPRALIVDVFARLRPHISERADRYAADYQTVEPFKALADDFGMAVVVVHHTRKQTADDYLESVSGTNGLAGAADTIMVLRRSRGQADAELAVTGRDIPEQSLALRFDPATGAWTLLGDSAEWHLSLSRKEIVDLLRSVGKPMKPKAIADALGRKQDAVRQAVIRMANDNQLETNGDGAYSPVPTTSPVTAVTPKR